MMLKGHRAQVLLALAACVGMSWLPTPTEQRRRALAPIAAFAATIQWARADAAFDEGRLDIGLARAERALEWNPSAAEGWSWLASVREPTRSQRPGTCRARRCSRSADNP